MRSAIFVALGVLALTPSAALAQRFPFERTFDASPPLTLEVQTIRGKIDVSVGEPGRIVVAGAATVRIGWKTPVNAAELARKIADRPPIERSANSIRLRPPANADERDAVTLN